MIRSAYAGNLRASDAGSTVTLAGWVASRRDHGGVAFLDLRDSSGVVQVVVHDPEVAHGLRDEYCLKITGTVEVRPAGNENNDLPSGAIEVMSTDVQVLSVAAPLPFPIDDRISVNDEIRLKYRYLDLRRQSAGDALRMRSKVNQIARDVLLNRDFLEIETPTLTRSTPEGARDFLVPVRLQPGSWYALPQSPQLFKQLLMVGGMERYFQIARCYRDEDFRADRQPEFTQLDIEMSFVEQEDIIELGEELVRSLWQGILGHTIGEIPRMTYHEAMRRFGSDKPDLRYGMELVELTDFFKDTPFRVFQSEYVGAVVMPGGADQPRRAFDAWQEWAKQRGAKGLAYVTVDANGELGGPVAKNISDEERAGIVAATGANNGDCIFFAAGRPNDARPLLGATRDEIARRLELIEEGTWSFLWVIDAPMFEMTDEGTWTAVHHPFTSPNTEWIDNFEEAPDQALAWAYDIVCNGNEIGGGSIRIHQADVQERVFALLGMSEAEANDKFGFLLEAFKFGPPPHGGIALGWDRICMLLAGAPSLRDVIAFPKTGGGQDPLTSAPTPITAQQRKEAGIDGPPVKAVPATPQA
ncbi:MAG: aspartate--tRNA ligase [Candidatus Nanopelagicales bacterium]|nr:aspartate--tRNA ligase [Candidatus Nanopelagicales bacterium]